MGRSAQCPGCGNALALISIPGPDAGSPAPQYAAFSQASGMGGPGKSGAPPGPLSPLLPLPDAPRWRWWRLRGEKLQSESVLCLPAVWAPPCQGAAAPQAVEQRSLHFPCSAPQPSLGPGGGWKRDPSALDQTSWLSPGTRGFSRAGKLAACTPGPALGRSGEADRVTGPAWSGFPGRPPPQGAAAPHARRSSVSGSSIRGALLQQVLLEVTPDPHLARSTSRAVRGTQEDTWFRDMLDTGVWLLHTRDSGGAPVACYPLPNLPGTRRARFPWALCQWAGRQGARWQT